MPIQTFYREKEVKKIVKDQFTLTEFTHFLINLKPEELFHTHHSVKKPMIYITKYTKDGLVYHTNDTFEGNYVDKQVTFEEFYELLRKQDLTQWSFRTED